MAEQNKNAALADLEPDPDQVAVDKMFQQVDEIHAMVTSLRNQMESIDAFRVSLEESFEEFDRMARDVMTNTPKPILRMAFKQMMKGRDDG